MIPRILKRALRLALALIPQGETCEDDACLRILTYHRVNDDPDDPVAIHPEQFDWQMAYISENYEVVSLGDIGSLQAQAKPYVAVTFDDGYLDNYTVAAPILGRYGILASFFVTTSYIATDKRFAWDIRDNVDAPMMGWDEVRALSREGHLIGAHTRTHPQLSLLEVQEQEEQIYGSAKDIEQQLGGFPALFAYPFGRTAHFNSESEAVARKYFNICCTNIRGLNRLRNCNVFSLRRSNVQRWWGQRGFVAELKGAYDFLENFRK